ncbi:MAG: FAD-dependent oxidoreductase [Ignavibacteriales bacterium]|nr:FAD-dependent oxidoreductase [Ignavibacteriales bacterium]
MKSCLVVGGGLSGLSAAVHLASNNYQVTLLEASPKIGGRAYSFHDETLDSVIDNGQHIIMGCYNATMEFVKLTGAGDRFIYQDTLDITTVMPAQKMFRLSASTNAYPLNLLSGILNYNVLNFSEQLFAVWLLVKALFPKPQNINLQQWLEKNGQSENANKALWEFLAVGALNTSMQKADAAIFVKIIRRIFLHGNFASTIILPKDSLTDSFITPALDFLKSHKTSVLLSSRVTEVLRTGNRVTGVVTSSGVYNDFDEVVLAIPPYAVAKIKGLDDVAGETDTGFTYSSILTVHCKVAEHTLNRPFYGLIGSPINWVFVHGNILTTVTSDADAYNGLPDYEILSLVQREILRYLGITLDKLQSHRIIREKRATFIPNSSNLPRRPSTITAAKNLFLAGDWIDTGLPATIESAILSGKMAADAITKL